IDDREYLVLVMWNELGHLFPLNPSPSATCPLGDSDLEMLVEQIGELELLILALEFSDDSDLSAVFYMPASSYASIIS
ncbi:hypothetical protein H671_5g14605, partial [Cricetulus griseus]